MNNKRISRIVAVVLIAIAALMPARVTAYDFKEGGIYYNVNNGEAEVTYCVANSGSYSGEVVIPETVTHAGVTYPVTAIGNAAFDWCSVLTGVVLPNSIDSIANFAFQRCSSLKSIVIPNSVRKMGNCVFWRSGLEQAVIGNSLEVIGDYCFQYCYGLKEVVLGASIRHLAIKAFFDCPSLKSVTCLSSTPPSMYAYYSFCDEAYRNATLKVSGASMEAYKANENWSRFRSYANLSLAEQLALDKTTMSLNVGVNVQLTATILPEEASQDLVWTSSNPEIARVGSNGWVTGVSVGETIITAATTDGSNLEASCVVRVLPDGVMASNQLTMPWTLTVEKGLDFVLPVAMVNEAEVTAVQCDVNLPDGIELATDGDNYMIDLVESRATTGHMINARALSPGVVRVIVSSMQSQPFAGNDGELMVLHLNVNPDIEDGNYDVTLTNVILADANARTYYAPDVTTHINVKSYARGDANGDGTVNVGDYVTIANRILDLDPVPFIFSAADVDESGSIDVGDLVGVASIVLGDFTMPAATPSQDKGGVALNGASTATGDNRVVVTLNMNNDVPLAAWQLDVELPEGMTLAEANLSSRASRHSLAVNELADGRIRLLASSTLNDVVDGNEGALLTLVLEGNAAADAAVTVSDALLAEADMTIHAVAPFGVSINNSAVNELDAAVRIYSVDGQIIVETPAETTVELITPSGMTRMMKAHAGVNTYHAERGISIVRAAGRVAKLHVQ